MTPYRADYSQSKYGWFSFALMDQLLKEQSRRSNNRELSQILNYNGSHLSRIVKKATGKSLFDYNMTSKEFRTIYEFLIPQLT